MTSADTDLYARLQGSAYTNNGAVSIQTNIDAALAETNVVFYIAALNDAGVKTVTPSITVTLSCIGISSVTVAYNSAESVASVLPYTTDGHLYKIFFGTPSTSETVNLNDVTTFSTDVATCSATGIDLVTSSAGDTAYSGAVFSESNFVLTVATNAPFYGSLFLKTLTYRPTISNVDKVLVSICGDQVITNGDQSNAVFAITGSRTTTSAWTPYSLAGIWTTQGGASGLPLNECPVTDIKVCEDNACNTELTEASGLRITSNAGVFSLEVDKSVVAADPQITRYFKVISYSVNTIESFTVSLLDCTAQTITLAGEATSASTRELQKDNGV